MLPGLISVLAVPVVLLLGPGELSWVTSLGGVGLTLLYLFAYLSPFQSSVGGSVPTMPVLLGALLTCPLHLVPAMILTAVVLAGLVDGKRTARSMAFEVGNVLHVFAPVAVLWHTRGPAGVAHPSSLLLAAAILAQFLADAVAAYLMERPSRTPARALVRPLAWTWTIDALMAVIGWGLVQSAHGRIPLLLMLVLAPILLVRFLGADREAYLRQTLEMQTKFSAADAAAQTDPMTGCANRLGWDRSVQAAEDRLHADSHLVGTVLVADLDKLKIANDTYGHEVGDRLITEFAALLRDCAPADATVARLGGDEFAVLCVAPARRGEVDLVTSVRQALRRHEGGLPVRLSASLGQAHMETGGDVRRAVLVADERARADKAVRRASREHAAPDFTPGAPGARGPGSPVRGIFPP
ncbi:GGDEF domain-containing protein [Arsenicicoccus dermatophilus]|uniref:GGDEF domain-containing protein n=1 Tax=Arsenicicoccus dermatophilus TaxID=1076331 RepID=UPI0039176710